jgi:hypothetical protein
VYPQENAIWGVDIGEVAQSLIDLITTHQDETIYLNGGFDDKQKERQCGSKILPCSSLVNGVSHLLSSDESRLFVDSFISLPDSVSFKNLVVKAKGDSASINYVDPSHSTPIEGMIVCSSNVTFERVSFFFPSAPSSLSISSFLLQNPSVIKIGHSPYSLKNLNFTIFLIVFNLKNLFIETISATAPKFKSILIFSSGIIRVQFQFQGISISFTLYQQKS